MSDSTRQTSAFPDRPTPDLSRLTFVFAKTMPNTPHEYVVRSPENKADYVALFRAVQEHGKDERFQKRRYRYWHAGDGWKYWAMTTDERQSRIINRAKVDDAGGRPLGDGAMTGFG
jgi:hypothetical protein